MRVKRICFVTTSLGMGGAERQICDLADKLIDDCYDVSIISLVGDEVVLPRNKNIKIISLDLKKNIISLFMVVIKIIKCLNEISPDIVHSHMYHANIITRLIKPLCKFDTLICTAHNTNEGGRIRMLMYRLTDFLSNINTNVSDEAVEAFVSKGAVPNNKMITIYNGIDEKRFSYDFNERINIRNKIDLDDDCKLFVAVGRLEEQKDYPNLIKAFKIVKNKGVKCKLVIIGKGSLRLYLEGIIKDYNLYDSVIFMGLQYNVESWLSASDVFVLSSKYEGFGLVVAEAMLCRAIVVATDSGGVKEVVGGNGFLIPPQNEEMLAAGMLRASSLSVIEKNKILNCAFEHVKSNYSLSSISEQWKLLYDETNEKT